MKKWIDFSKGHNCKNFECKWEREECYPGSGGRHGIGSVDAIFYVKGPKGAVQFKLSLGLYPYIVENNRAYRSEHNRPEGELFPADLGYHSYEPQYASHKPITDSCGILDGEPCYYDGSTTNAYDAMAALANAGEEGLWQFLEGYYKHTFEDAEYPQIPSYSKPRR